MDVNTNAYPEAWAIDRGLDYVLVPMGKCSKATYPSADGAIKIVAEPSKGIHTCALGHHGFRLENDLASTFVKVQGHTKKKSCCSNTKGLGRGSLTKRCMLV